MNHTTHFFPGYLKPFQCMLAAKCPKSMTTEQFMRELRLPLWETPKIDGIRCITLDMPGDRSHWYSMPMSRHMKPIPNAYMREQLGANCPPGLDGELVLMLDADDGHDQSRIAGYYESSSAILSYGGEPKFKYMVFDYITPETRLDGYLKRIEQLKELRLPSFCEILEPSKVSTLAELKERVSQRMDEGFEGSCLRTGIHEYKFGRSSLRQGALIAVKLFVDSDADVVGYECLHHNAGPALRNAQGHMYRRKLKEHMEPEALLGKLIGKDCDTGVEVIVGTGFTALQREQLWDQRKSLPGKRFKYKHQPFGSLEGGKPREPVFLGFREQ